MSDDLISQLKIMLIEGLLLEDIMPENISPDDALFSGGLGLDSIDALEIGVMLDRQFGIKIKSSDERNNQIFVSLRTLAEFVAANRTR
jgi:acyl carrier protein